MRVGRAWFGLCIFSILRLQQEFNVINHLNYASIAAVVGWPMPLGSFACQSVWISAKLISETGRISDEKAPKKEKQRPNGKKTKTKIGARRPKSPRRTVAQ